MLDYKVGHYVTWEYITSKQRSSILRSFMLLKGKTTPDGKHERTKARLVADGSQHGEHLYDKVSCATVTLQSVFLVLNIATYLRAKVNKFNVKGAFLHTPIQSNVQGEDSPFTIIKLSPEVVPLWIKQDPEAELYDTKNGDLYIKLVKYIYGLKQSPYEFSSHLFTTLKSISYTQSQYDECLYYRQDETGVSLISVHADDLLQCLTSDSHEQELMNMLTKVYKEIAYDNQPTSYLGMTMQISTDRSKISLSQEGLIKDLINKYLKSDDEIELSPTSTQLFNLEDINVKQVDRTTCLSALMTIMYIARLTRPDILLATSYFATKSQNPTTADWKRVIRIIKYLNYTSHHNIIAHCKDLKISVYCDASFASHKDGKSHTGWEIQLGESYLCS